MSQKVLVIQPDFKTRETTKLQSPSDEPPQTQPPRVRIPVRVKIVFPYAILALILTLMAVYLVSQIVLETLEARFTNQVIEMGKITADWMVAEENQLLETVRLLANTKGVAAAIKAEDSEALRTLALPIAINYAEDQVDILDKQGVSLLSMSHDSEGGLEAYAYSRGESGFREWPFVQHILNQRVDKGRDKYAGLAQLEQKNFFYVAGPIFDETGEQVGVILVGKSLETLVREIRQNTLAHTTIYDYEGKPLVSTLPSFTEQQNNLAATKVDQVLTQQDSDSLIHSITAASVDYSEILGPWEVRNGEDLGVIGTSLAQTFLVQPSQAHLLQIFVLASIAFLSVIVVGLFLAQRITSPLNKMVQASGQVATGNLAVEVEAAGNDEIAVLAHSFNTMLSGLREGSIYRDLLGRTVSPEVREQLRQTFATGELRLEGQNATATVLMTDVRGFTAMAEKENPTTILAWLNDYFGVLVPIIIRHRGVVNKFDGDAILAFFGILPQPLSAHDSANHACCAAVEMLQAIEQINLKRKKQKLPPFRMGIGLNTGEVTAGGLGAADRLQYTIIGDTVNTTQRIEGFTRNFNKSGIAVSEHTVSALGKTRRNFRLKSLGQQNFKGKSGTLGIYRLSPPKDAA